jgi:hypothetical protein
MKIHEKARLYDELLRDFKNCLQSMEDHHKEIDALEEREDIIKLIEQGLSSKYAGLCGAYKGCNFGLNLKISRFKVILNYYSIK